MRTRASNAGCDSSVRPDWRSVRRWRPMAGGPGAGGGASAAARRRRPLAMGVDAVGEMDMDRLGVLAAERGRARDIVDPFGADHDVAVAEAHLGVAEIPLLVGDHHRAFEAEGLLQPVERGKRILVE